MKVYYDKWGKHGHKENFKVENSETLKFGDNIFYGQFFNFETYTWSFPLDNLESVEKMFSGCTALGEFNSDLPKLKNGDGMFWGCSNLKTFNTNLSSLEDGREMFRGCSTLTTFTSDLSSLTDGYFMFQLCSNFESFSSNLGSLKSGYRMFSNCSKLTSFTSDLSSLTDGYYMFYYCENLTSFTSDLSSLTNGEWMFYACNKLTTFSSDSSGSPVNLSSLTNGKRMFGGCYELTEFNSDLPSLIDSYHMFYGCENLTTFSSDLGSLKSGYNMFYGCKLNTDSLRNIADNINNLVEKGYDKNIDEHWTHEVLGETETISSSYRGRIDIWHETSVSEEDVQYCGNKLIDKGWTVYFNDTLYEYTIPYDVSEANGYIPHADGWNENIYKKYNLTITRITKDGRMLNDE